jgi:hypothetical protein
MSVFTNESMGFVRVGCMIADLLKQNEIVKPHSSLTDLHGEFGEPIVFTEWGITTTDGTGTRVVLREIRWPDAPERDCQHWVPAPGFDYKAWGENS